MTHFQSTSTSWYWEGRYRRFYSDTHPNYKPWSKLCADDFYLSSPKSENECGRQCTKCLKYTTCAPADLYEAHNRSTNAYRFVCNETCSNWRETQKEQNFYALRWSNVSGQSTLISKHSSGIMCIIYVPNNSPPHPTWIISLKKDVHRNRVFTLGKFCHRHFFTKITFRNFL